MQKEFDEWNKKKKYLDARNKKFLFHMAEIWWCSVGLNIAAESCGKGIDFQRPVLVLKKLSSENFVGIPLSSQQKTGSWFVDITVHGEKRYALLYQVRMFSARRFQRRLCTLEDGDFERVKQKLKTLLELCESSPEHGSGSVGNPKSNQSIDILS